jgi:hypothetical protein
MAGYGGLGGLGGFAYPTRRSSPFVNSSPVQSDAEFNNAWQSAMPSQYIQAPGGTQLVAGAGGYNAAAADPMRQSLTQKMEDEFTAAVSPGASEAQLAGLRAAQEFARQAGVAMVAGPQANGGSAGIYMNPYSDKGGAAVAELGGGHFVYPEETGSMMINPAWEAKSAEWNTAATQRGENQIRQQQAYDTNMMGNGAIGGVMPSNYGDANYGQITGQKSGGLGGLGGTDLTGTQTTQQTGSYMGGSGSYNPNPFAAGSFKSQNPWGGF